MNKILVVDLDETLIFSNTLYETFWRAFSKDYKIPFKSIAWLLSGKTKLKNNLCVSSDLNVENLPYNIDVINYIKQHRKEGGYTALVTGSNQAIAEKIAKHLNLFDEVKGSSIELNLKGKSKAEFLKTRFGVKNYDYMGDSLDDLPVWKNANKSITVNANPSIIKACEKVNSNCQHLKSKSSQSTFINYIKTIRMYQWIKNILVFVPMIAAHQITTQNFIESLLGFIAFSLIASSIYIINDLLDLNFDRDHHYKKLRPLASGNVSIKNGLIIFSILLIIGIMLSLFIGFDFFLLMAFYLILTSGYSLILKKKPIIDIFILGILYTLRIFAGGIVTEIQISFWLYIFSIFLFLSLAAVKRQSELISLKKKELAITDRNYHISDLFIVSQIALSSGFVSVLVVGLYINSPDVLILYSKPWTLGGMCLVLLFWLMKIIFDSSRGLIEYDPIVYALKDNQSKLCLITMTLLLLINFI